jgi:hypothetical protein
MPNPIGRPRKYPPFQESIPQEHTIYADGTYSNDSEKVEIKVEKPKTIRERLAKNMVLQFGAGPMSWSGVVHQIVEHGVYCRPDLHKEVDISCCTFYNWEEIETQVVGIA